MIRRTGFVLAATAALFVSGCKSCCPFCETFAWTLPEMPELPALIMQWWQTIAG
jgi:organic radical activating enzyme